MFTRSVRTGGNFIEVVEVYPPTWQSIVDGKFVWDRPEQTALPGNAGVEELVQQTILLHCLLGRGKPFVVRLNYGFRVVTGGYSQMYPLTLEIVVAKIESGLSLAETMIVHKDHLDMVLDWQQQLDLVEGILTFRVEKEGKLPLWTLHPEINRTRASQIKSGAQILPKPHSNALEDIRTPSYFAEQ